MFTTRFAPSPTGLLHLGHIYAAHQARAKAHDSGGKFLIRLEDIDPQRCRDEYAKSIIEDLTWLGLTPDASIRSQSQHLAEYAATLEALREKDLLYPCFCSRAAIAREAAASAHAPHAPDGAPIYPGTCRDLPPSEAAARIANHAPHLFRLNMRRALACLPANGANLQYFEQSDGWCPCTPDIFGDVVLARREIPASYHLCVTHDDALQNITLVTRGTDLRPATSIHRLLQEILKYPAPQYAHHPLLTAPNGQRLAKRDRAQTIASLRAGGLTPSEILALATPK